MYERDIFPSRHGLETIGFDHRGQSYWNLSPAELVYQAIQRREGRLSNAGALVTRTGKRTGRSPKDKFVVNDPATENTVHWGDVNAPWDPKRFDALQRRMYAYLAERDIFVQDLFVGAHPAHRFVVRVVAELAWHSLFARQLFIRPAVGSTTNLNPDYTVICAPGFLAEPSRDGTNSETFILLNLSQRLILIGGTGYAGEIKKSIFTVMNYVLPLAGVLSMHCSANMGANNDVALFFGLSGTGKTTLSADPERRLIGDDEHGWGDDGIFNFEGGCYAKVIGLSTQDEPQIYGALKFGAVLENVIIAPYTHTCCFDDASLTENTRAAYPLDYIDNACDPAIGGHPNHIVFLTCDAFGVLPPLARLTPEQAMYHFLSGYTAKVAGTEAGMGSEPSATFSTCFGAPFLPLNPRIYADLLGRKIQQHRASVWLLNTGWTGGPFGVGHRIKLRYTRAMVRAALSGALEDVPFQPDPIFGVEVPRSCPDVPRDLLTPRTTWKDPDAYDAKARELATRFAKNFEKFGQVAEEIRGAGPRAEAALVAAG